MDDSPQYAIVPRKGELAFMEWDALLGHIKMSEADLRRQNQGARPKYLKCGDSDPLGRAQRRREREGR